MLAGDLPRVAHAALTEGASGLAGFAVQLFRPVLPMLAGTAETVEDALAELGEAALEWKLDGARVQIHKAGDEVRVYSRLLNEVTPAVPELVEVARALAPRELIVEGEAIALRPDGTPHPFQTTMSRFGRRLDVVRGAADHAADAGAVRHPVPRWRLAHGRAAHPQGGRLARVRCPRRCACRVSSPTHPSRRGHSSSTRWRAATRGSW